MSLFSMAKAEDVSVREMIDRYLANGGSINKIPTTDSRIKPYKHVLNWDSVSPNADAGTVIRATRERRAPAPRAYENWPPSEAVITKVGECQSAPGSSRAQRFEILEVGATLGQMRERGLRLSDLTRYLGSGAVEISVTEPGAPATAEVTQGQFASPEDVRPEEESDEDDYGGI